MARYLVERNFEDGLAIPVSEDGAEICREVVERNADHGVTWVHSYVDKRKTFCIYDAPNPESVRRTAALNQLPVDSITEIRVLDP
jgi:hypothetical protein